MVYNLYAVWLDVDEKLQVVDTNEFDIVHIEYEGEMRRAFIPIERKT